ncbi:uncharacterized protein LOC144870738 [Branchiostoma floridae x Branchiostoma japonicum]
MASVGLCFQMQKMISNYLYPASTPVASDKATSPHLPGCQVKTASTCTWKACKSTYKIQGLMLQLEAKGHD